MQLKEMSQEDKDKVIENLQIIRDIKGVILIEGVENWLKVIRALFPEANKEDLERGFTPFYKYSELSIYYVNKPLTIKQQTIIEI